MNGVQDENWDTNDAPNTGDGLTEAEVENLARRLREARLASRTLSAFSGDRPLPLADAYRIQARLTASRLADGERRIGWKLGYTSAAMREQMGIDAPNYGPLTDVMLLPDGARVPGTALQPRVEPEIAVVLGERATELAHAIRALGPTGAPRQAAGVPGDAGPGDDAVIELAAAAVTAVHVALEVVDSIWTGYRFRLEDNTADGSSAAWFVLGPQLFGHRLPEVRVELGSASSGVQTGSGADADGHPLRGVAWLAARLDERGEQLQAGNVILTGGLTKAVPLDGRVHARFTQPGGPPVEVSVLPPG